MEATGSVPLSAKRQEGNNLNDKVEEGELTPGSPGDEKEDGEITSDDEEVAAPQPSTSPSSDSSSRTRNTSDARYRLLLL